ncbi:MAG: hypothetical protein ACOZEN_04520 [Thermodesulfobacteriota bacterium]
MEGIPPAFAFWDDIQGYFTRIFYDILEGRVTLESVMLVVVFFGSFFLLTALSYVFAKKPRKLMLEHPVTWIMDYGRVMELLDSAVMQRSKVRVSFHRDMGGARSSDGVLIEAGEKGLVLEMSSIKTITPSWIGRTLELSFRLRLPEQPQLQSTFAFMSEITAFEPQQGDILLLKLTRPRRLELNQNRLHLRVDPPEKYVKSLRIWSEDAVRRRGDPKDPDSWGEPAYATEQGQFQELSIENLSGGGARLKIAPAALRAKMHKITVGQQFYARIVLADPDLSGFSTHYVLMRVLKCYDDCESRTELSLGFAFTASGTPFDPPLTGLRWRAVNRDYGIREMDDWAYELHLELYRNKGMA